MQLDETQREVAAEHERSKAAESALEAQRRERRAAEYVRSRPTSPHRDAALHAELAHLRLQVPQHSMLCMHACMTVQMHSFAFGREDVMQSVVRISGPRWTAATFSSAKHGQILKGKICSML